MKKILSIFLLLIICVFSYNSINADDSVDIRKWNYSLIADHVDPWDCRLAQYKNTETNKIGFCIEPDVKFDRATNNYKKTKSSNLSNEYLVKIIHAYDYLSNNSLTRTERNNYYIAAQFMIWEEVTGIIPKIDDNDAYYYGKQDILDYINNELSVIDINVNDINDAIYLKEDIIEFEDIELDNYDIESVGLDIKVEDNKILYQVNSIYPLEKSINITPKVDYIDIENNSTFIYKSDTSQDILSFEDNFPLYLKGTSLNLSMKTGNLHLTKKDEFGELVLDNLIFHVYDSNDNEIFQNDGSNFYIENGYLNIDNILPVGDYYLLEEENDKYIIIDEPIYFSIDEDKTTDLEVINKHANISITFNKLDENGNKIKGAEFKIYDLNESNEKLKFIQINQDVNLLDTLTIIKYDNPTIKLSERYERYLNGNVFNSNEIGYFTYEIYDSSILKESGKVYVVDDISLSNGEYNEISCKLIDTLYTEESNIFSNLQLNHNYLLCETEPYLGYEYVANPCIRISTYDSSYKDKITFINKTRNYTLKLQKISDKKEILLDGAKFNVKYYDSNKNEYHKEYITGHSNDNIKGGFLIKEIPYNMPVIIKEIEAPKGYIIDNNEYVIYPNIKYSELTFTNNRVNSAIILPPYRIVKTCVEK